MTVTTHKDGARFYRIPVGGQVIELPSATTVLRAIPAPALENWKRSNAVFEVVKAPDLTALVASATKASDRAVRDAINQALDRNRAAANTGTALHTLTEQADQGGDLSGLPPELAQVMDGYRQLRSAHGFTVIESEQIVFNTVAGYAGRFDKIADFPGLGRIVVDVKTGKGVYPEVALQLAAYAHAENIFDDEAGEFWSMPDGLRTDLGAVLHLPADGTPPVVKLVDLTTAWPVFQAAAIVRKWMDDTSKTAILGTHSPTPVDDAERLAGRRSYLLAVLDEVKALDAAAVDAIRRSWPTGVPGLRTDHAHTSDELQQIVDVVDAVAAHFKLPFFDADDPVHTPEPLATIDQGIAVAARITRLPADLARQVEQDEPAAAAGRLIRVRCTMIALDRISRRVAAAEAEHANRVELADVSLPADPDARQAVLATAGVATVDRLTALGFDTVVAVTAALRGDYVQLRHDGDRYTVVVATDACDRLADLYGGKQVALDMARTLAKALSLPSPRSFASTAASVPLIAHMAIGAPHTHKKKEAHA